MARLPRPPSSAFHCRGSRLIASVGQMERPGACLEPDQRSQDRMVGRPTADSGKHDRVRPFWRRM